MPVRKPTFLILAGAQPPKMFGFQRHTHWWWKKVNTLMEALDLAKALALINIHGIIKTLHPDKPPQPFFPRHPYIKDKSQIRSHKTLPNHS